MITKTIAKLKILKDRAIGWFGIWTYFLMALVYFKIELPIIYTVGFFLLCLLMTMVDWLFIFPREQEFYWERNPAYKRLRDKK